VLLLSASWAATLVVDPAGSGDATTIQGGISLAVSGDTVEILPGNYNEDLDFSGKTLQVVGRDGAGATTVTGTGAGPVVRIDSGEGAGTALIGLTITGGDASTFSDSNLSGGGVFVDGAAVILQDLVITGNKADFGGGVMLSNASGSSISNCTFSSNEAGAGGGLYIYGGSVSLSSSSFSLNSSGADTEGYGGGAIFYSATVTAQDIVWSDNVVSKYGGSLYSYGGAFDCTSCTIQNSTAASGGGAYLSNTMVTLSLVEVSGNVVTDNGGGMNLNSSPTTANRLKVSGNTASYGGGILLANTTLSGVSVSLQYNVAVGGGGLYNDGGILDLRNSLLIGNTASASNGGGIALDGGQAMITASIFSINSAYSGGGIHSNDGSTATLTNVGFTENSGTASAGGIRASSGGTIVVKNTVVAWSSIGSGISADAEASADIQYGNLYSNANGATSDELVDPTGTSGNIASDPLFISFTADNIWNDDLNPGSGSPHIDAGDPTILDADGSRSDIGPFGGIYGMEWDMDWDGVSLGGGDCDDDDSSIYPGAQESCNGVDEDCDGSIDEDCGEDSDEPDDSAPPESVPDDSEPLESEPSESEPDSSQDSDPKPVDDSNTDDSSSITGEPPTTKDQGECGCQSPGGSLSLLGLLGLLIRRRQQA
jgi:hypothetical protein